MTYNLLLIHKHPGENKCVFLTATVTFLLITAIQTVDISIAAPANGDAMAVFTLELITVTLHITAILDQTKRIFSLVPLACQILRQNVNQNGNGGAIPHLNRQRSHGPHRTSSARQCSGHLCRKTRSPNTGEALRTERTQLRRVTEDN